ncbi:MAG: hypothetical protein P8J79_06295 [Halioglobus sp.]|nr:hypothetical protein [Halioglobus sp.]
MQTVADFAAKLKLAGEIVRIYRRDIGAEGLLDRPPPYWPLPHYAAGINNGRLKNYCETPTSALC